jgi:hypothetical protein
LGWYKEQTRSVVGVLELWSWMEVEAKMNDFAWLGTACHAGGMKLWGLVVDEKT